MQERSTASAAGPSPLNFLNGGGEMGARIRHHDWQATPFGAPGVWPQALRGAVGICLQSSFPTAIYWGAELRLLYNDAWAAIPAEKHPWALGRPAREVWADIWHVIEPQFQQVLDTAQGLSAFDEMLPMRRGGRVVETYWNYSFTPILDGGGEVLGIFNQGNETTEHVFAARQSEAEVDRLRELFEQAPGAVAVLNGRQHVFEMANPAYLQLVGRRDILGKPVADALPEVVEQGFVDMLDQVFSSGAACIGESAHLKLQRDPDAEPDERVLDFVYQPIKSAAGTVTGIFVQATDVTERARTEAALRRREAELSDADRRKDEFLATLAHELRNPLAPIMNAARLIELEAGESAGLVKAAGIVTRQVRHMVRLVDDLLDVSRITRGRIDLRVERIRLGTIVANAVEAAEPMIAEKRHELTVALPEAPVSLEGDPVRLSQALLNVINNATRYTPAGGRIRIGATSEGDSIRIAVADTGIGIREESLDSIFELFTQGDESSERGIGGLGIGLRLARELVALHGGTLTAASPGPGRGSEFVLVLPTHVPPRIGGPRRDTAAPAGLSPRRVLVVDDNVDAADSLAMNLQRAGHEVLAVYGGAAALDAMDELRPHVVLLDIGMPGMNGYETAEAIRRGERGRDVLLVALTGWGQGDDQRRAARAGFDRHLTKPVDPATIDGLVRGARTA